MALSFYYKYDKSISFSHGLVISIEVIIFFFSLWNRCLQEDQAIILKNRGVQYEYRYVYSLF